MSLRRIAIVSAIVVVCLSLPCAAATATNSDPELQKLLQQANDKLTQGAARSALSDFQKAEKRSNNTSALAFWGEARARYALGEYKEAAAACQKVVAVEPNAEAQAIVQNFAGIALTQASGKKNDKLMKEAEQEFRSSLEKKDNSSTRMNLAVVLICQNRVDEGVVELKKIQASTPNPSSRIQRLIDHPELAKVDLAPDFSAKTLDGQTVSMEGLEGKVVLLDFWASWCGPCRMTLPTLKKEYAKLSSQPVVFLSISADESEAKLRSFLENDKPLWAQVFDGDDSIRTLYSVHSFPTFVVVGPDSVIRYRSTGADDVPIGEVKKQLKALQASAGAQAKAAGEVTK